VEILQVWGLPVLIRRDPAPLLLNAQCLTLGAKGTLGRAEGASGWAEAFSGSGVSSVLTEG
jgi:hypothetical protein